MLDNATLIVSRESIEELETRLARRPAVGLEEGRTIAIRLAHAVAALHRAGIIHRDIKPDNILLTAAGQAKLADLGLSKDLETDQGLTCADRGLGTPNFIAPEQFGK